MSADKDQEKFELSRLWDGGKITEEDIRISLLGVSEMLRAQENIKKQRGWRGKVDPLTLEYDDYRKTKLWKIIKTRVLMRDHNCCQRCKGSADLVHHISYSPSVMTGAEDSKLISLCHGCHALVHFKATGEKRNQQEQISALTDMTLNEIMPKFDLRMTRQPKIWDRLTAVQKEQWSSFISTRKNTRLEADLTASKARKVLSV